jgi:diacylglycerol O-acyltransferase
MRGSDAMFLYFEKKEMPLHIGAVAILEGPFDEESEQLLATRLPEIPRYRQRLVFSPMNMSHPSWVDDPAFDIRNHIRRVRLDPPGNDAQLSALSGEVFTPLMDRNRPLWDLTVVDGLEGGRSALIFRVHHSMVDGVSGIGLVNSIFDPTRQPRVVEPRPYDPPPLPDPRQVIVESLSGVWADAAERLIGTQLTVMRIAQAFLSEQRQNSMKGLLATAPELMKPTETLPFNTACSGVRGHCWATFPFGEARAIRAALGGTINDVVLTAVTGAFSKYVLAHREPVEGRFIRMMVPVSLRQEDPHGTVGNDISFLPLSVPLDIEDPAERMKAVTMRSGAMKAARVADFVQLIGTWIGWIPTSLQESIGALPFMPHPVMIVNTVCTNVPGPMVPLYANGRQVLSYYPHVPCGCNVGLSVAIASYNGNLHYGVTYDMQAAPDGELFRDFLVESYEELRAAAGVPAMKAAVPTVAPKPKPADALREHRKESGASFSLREDSSSPEMKLGPPPAEPEKPREVAKAATVPPNEAKASRKLKLAPQELKIAPRAEKPIAEVNGKNGTHHPSRKKAKPKTAAGKG